MEGCGEEVAARKEGGKGRGGGGGWTEGGGGGEGLGLGWELQLWAGTRLELGRVAVRGPGLQLGAGPELEPEVACRSLHGRRGRRR